MAAIAGFSHVPRVTTPILQGDEELEKRHLQIYNVDSVVDEKLDAIVQRSAPMDLDECAIYGDLEAYIVERTDAIEDHLDRSIELFFLTAICCFETKFYYDWVSANDQYGKGRNAKLKTPDGEVIQFNTHGAHSSVLPCLMAYPKEDWEQYKANGGDKPEGFIYLKHSHAYRKNNGTLELERTINQADCRRDGTHRDKMLREKAIKIINDVAEGKYGPQEATRKFRDTYILCVEKAQSKLKEGDFKKTVLEIYLNRLDQIDLEDDLSFDQLLGVQIEHSDEDLLRSIVYAKRFALIREIQVIESQIAKVILDKQNEMLKKNGKSLRKVDYRLRYILLENMNPIMRKRLEKLFCTSLAQLQSGIEINEERLRSFEGSRRITSFRENHADKIRELTGKLRRRFVKIEQKKDEYRAHLFKGLRKDFLGVQQWKFAEMFKKVYPNEPMSQSMVSRLENLTRPPKKNKEYATPLCERRKIIKVEKALMLAEVFGVQPGLFLTETA